MKYGKNNPAENLHGKCHFRINVNEKTQYNGAYATLSLGINFIFKQIFKKSIYPELRKIAWKTMC